jgi:hypothetical protein
VNVSKYFKAISRKKYPLSRQRERIGVRVERRSWPLLIPLTLALSPKGARGSGYLLYRKSPKDQKLKTEN